MYRESAKIYHTRLYNAARAVEEFDHSRDKATPGLVDMGNYVKPCGSPACVLGHYAARQDLQDVFELRVTFNYVEEGQTPIFANDLFLKQDPGGARVHYDSIHVRNHFGIMWEEAEKLFSSAGCNTQLSYNTHNTNKPTRVARYLREFADRKFPEALT